HQALRLLVLRPEDGRRRVPKKTWRTPRGARARRLLRFGSGGDRRHSYEEGGRCGGASRRVRRRARRRGWGEQAFARSFGGALQQERSVGFCAGESSV